MSMVISNPDNDLLYVGFNQDAGCFACGTDAGFRIYNVDPFREMFRRDFPSGGIGIVEMLYRCNILALVGGGRNPRHPANKVMIWDDHQNRCIGELSFRSDVKAVKLRRDRVVVVLEHKIYGYNFRDLKLVDRIETVPNPLGLCALCPLAGSSVLACPGRVRGHVHVELYSLGKKVSIPAHESELQALALNSNGTRVATASEKGTIVRVFNASTGQLLHELRRGAERAIIHCLAFSPNSSFLALSSDKCTVHIFSLGESLDTASGNESQQPSSVTTGNNGEGAEITSVVSADSNALTSRISRLGILPPSDSNDKSAIGFMKGFLPKYFTSDRSYAQLRVPESHTICAFGSNDTIIVIGADGTFWKASYKDGGECRQLETFTKFVKEKDHVMQ